MTTARPILFSAPMVRALLDGSKTQTRRAVNIPEKKGNNLGTWEGTTVGGKGCYFKDGSPSPECAAMWHTRTGYCFTNPYGKPGDLLWVRETALFGPDRVAYCADNPTIAPGERVDGWGRKRPGIHMPRWASRLTLEITNVRVEQGAHCKFPLSY